MTTDFPWGEVVKLHKIDGLPVIVEYKVGPEFENAGKVEFHVAGLNCSYDSLDEALLGALCSKHGSEEALPYVVKLVYDEPATGVVSAKIRTSEAADRIFDLLQQGADGQAYKEAERYLEKHAPELYNRLT